MTVQDQSQRAIQRTTLINARALTFPCAQCKAQPGEVCKKPGQPQQKLFTPSVGIGLTGLS